MTNERTPTPPPPPPPRHQDPGTDVREIGPLPQADRPPVIERKK